LIELSSYIKDASKTDEPVVLARVISTWGSSPRPVGSCMLIDKSGKMRGSVSGGCVEGAVIKEAQGIFEHKSSKQLSFGVTNDDAWSVGLSCGGKVEVLLQYLDFENPLWKSLCDLIDSDKSSVLITEIDGTRNLLIGDSSVGDQFDHQVVKDIEQLSADNKHGIISSQDISFFVQQFPRKSLLIIIGAAHLTADLASLANTYGFKIVIIDPRQVFTEGTDLSKIPLEIRTEYPSEVLPDYPLDNRTYCAILSHDPKIDDDALQILLPSDVAYIGALGSRKTHENRVKRLKERGISEQLIDRIQSPIGINITAKTAQEIALSIMGEIIQVKNGSF